MCESLTIISRARSGFERMSEAMELRVLKRKWGLIWRWRASRRASRRRRDCSSSLCSMRTAFQIFSGMPTTTGAQEQMASSMNQELE